METPEPVIQAARQFFTQDGSEIFFAEASGRRPDVKDALRVMGWGFTRAEAGVYARQNWRQAWRALRTKSLVGKA